MPSQVREELKILYTFCRYVDDSVDCAVNADTGRKTIERVLIDLKRKTSLIAPVADFLRLAELRNIPISFAIDLALGVRSDLPPVLVADEEQLLRYCYSVAGTVGTMICYLLEVTDREAIAFGIDLGIAMQLTNIARDVFEDHQSNRVYLPELLVSQSTIAKASQSDLDSKEHLLAAVRRILTLAEQYYESSENGIVFLPQSTRFGILAASRCYREIGHLILKFPERYFRERIYLSLLQKQLCFFLCYFDFHTKNMYHSKADKSHQIHLHNSLRGLASFDLILGKIGQN